MCDYVVFPAWALKLTDRAGFNSGTQIQDQKFYYLPASFHEIK